MSRSLLLTAPECQRALKDFPVFPRLGKLLFAVAVSDAKDIRRLLKWDLRFKRSKINSVTPAIMLPHLRLAESHFSIAITRPSKQVNSILCVCYLF